MLNVQWIVLKKGCYRDFEESIRTTQYSADTEVIASQKQKDTLNTFKFFLQAEEQLLEKKMLEDNKEQ